MKNGKKLMQSTATLTKILKETQQCVRSGQDDMFYIEAKIPLRFINKTLANFKGDTKKYKQAILEGQSIFITGSCGIGKTHLAVALATEWFAENLHITDSEIQSSKGYPLFLPATELFLKLKTSFSSKSQTEADILNELDNYNLLILDDLGTDKVSEWSKEIVYLLIDRRYRNMQQIIITSNLSLKEIAQRYDERIASRILGMGIVVRLGGKDKRLK